MKGLGVGIATRGIFSCFEVRLPERLIHRISLFHWLGAGRHDRIDGGCLLSGTPIDPMENVFRVIKYEGDNQTFIWKHPIEDFNSGSQLVVHESQEAIFFMNGQALDSFPPGRHTLTSQNAPLVNRFFNRATDDQTPFHCEVYFVNLVEQMAIKWGTDSKVEYVEPTYQFPIQIGASGEMNLRVAEPRVLLMKVVGTERGLSQAALVGKFRAFLMTRLKTFLASLIREQRINIFQIDERLTEISETLHERLRADFGEYGVSLERFFVTTIVKPEEESNYQRFKQLHFRQYADVAEARLRQQVGVIEQQTQAQKMVIEAQGLAQKRSLEGYTYQDERGFDVAERMATNEAVGQFTNVGIGLGMLGGVSQPLAGTIQGAVANAMGNASTASPTPMPPPTSPPTGPQFHVAVDGKPAGPFAIADLQQRILLGTVTRSTQVWRPGMTGWQGAGDVAELAPFFQVPPVATPPLPPPVPPTP